MTRPDPLARLIPSRRLRRAYETLRADLSWLARDLRGERRPFLVERRGPARRRPGPGRLRPRPLRVLSTRRETDEVLSLELAEVDGAPLRFEAGQFLTLELEVEGRRLRRAYSLSSSPLDGGSATITVARVLGGRASGFLHEHAVPGMELLALGPSGSFVVPERASGLALIAGGAGITPIISIAETLRRARPELPFSLLYGSRDLSAVIFRERLEALDAPVDLVLEAAPEGWEGLVGRLDAGVLGAWLEADDGLRDYFVCGPEAMAEGAREVLLARGVDRARIHLERFRSPADSPGAGARLPDRPVTMRLRIGGAERVAEVAPGRTILEAGLAAGARMPFSCAMGGCAACKCRLRSGEVAMSEPSCLTDEERGAGWILACSARPLGDVEVEVHP